MEPNPTQEISNVLPPDTTGGNSNLIITLSAVVGWVVLAPCLFMGYIFYAIGSYDIGRGNYFSKDIVLPLLFLIILVLLSIFQTRRAFRKNSALLAFISPIVSFFVVLILVTFIQITLRVYLSIKPPSTIFPTETRFVCSNTLYIDVHLPDGPVAPNDKDTLRIDLNQIKGSSFYQILLGVIKDNQADTSLGVKNLLHYMEECHNSQGKTVFDVYPEKQ